MSYGDLGHSVQFKNGGLLEEEENWSIFDSSERLRCVRRSDVDGVLDANI